MERRPKEWRFDIRRKEGQKLEIKEHLRTTEGRKIWEYQRQFEGDPGRTLISLLNTIYTCIKHQQKQSINHYFAILETRIKQQPSQISAFLFMLSSDLKQMMKNIINNRTCIDQGRKEWEKIQTSLQLDSILQLLKVFSMINFAQATKEILLEFIEVFWPLFVEDSFDYSANKNQVIMQELLKIIKKVILENINDGLQVFKQLDLSTHLAQIMKSIKSPSQKTILQIVDFLSIYLQQQAKLETPENKCQISGITILGMENFSHEIFVKLCMGSIRKKMQECILNALTVLLLIFKKNSHLQTLADQKFVKEIVIILKKSHKSIQLKVLELLCDLIAEQIDAIECILEKNFLVDALLQVLMGCSKQVEQETMPCVYVISCILNNLTLTNLGRIKQLLQHPIWKFAISLCQHRSIFSPLIVIFQHYFSQNCEINMLEQFLQKVSRWDLKMVEERQAEAIRKTIQQAYYGWPQEERPKVRRMLGEYHLIHLLQEMQQQQQTEMSLQTV